MASEKGPVSVNTSDYILESPKKGVPLTFTDKLKQSRFELGVCMVVYGWDNLQTAVDAQWGGADSADKRDWLVGSVVEMFEDSYVEAEDIEDRLIGVMEDEFGTVIQDDSALPIGAKVISVYRECAKGDFSTVDSLYKSYLEKEEKKKAGLITNKKVETVDDDASEYSGSEAEDNGDKKPTKESEDVEMKDSEPQGAIVDDDGFELVQKKGKGKKR